MWPRAHAVRRTHADGNNYGPRAQTFYTKDTFASAPKSLLAYTSRCLFAHEKKEFAADVPDELVFCAAYEPPSTSASSSSAAEHRPATLKDAISSLLGGPPRALKESRLYSSTDWFTADHQYVDLGIGKEARGVVGIGGVQKFLVTALKPSAAGPVGGGGGAGAGSGGRQANGSGGGGGGGGGASSGGNGEMVMYVTEDGRTWTRAQFPHGHGLRENAYTIVESTEHSILVDVNSSPAQVAGTLFTSNSNGTAFVRSLDATNRNRLGIVDFEKVVGVEGVAIVNTVTNVDAVEAGKEEKALKTKITFDDGASLAALDRGLSFSLLTRGEAAVSVSVSGHEENTAHTMLHGAGGHWSLIPAPAVDHEGRKVKCDVSDLVRSLRALDRLSLAGLPS